MAIAYVMHKTTHVFPIIGGRKIEHLQANIAALDITLSDEQIKFLEDALPFNPGFPLSFCVSTYSVAIVQDCRVTDTERLLYLCLQGDGSQYIWLMKSAGNFVRWPRPQPIRQ